MIPQPKAVPAIFNSFQNPSLNNGQSATRYPNVIPNILISYYAYDFNQIPKINK
jgi:hypothetical protein